MSTRRLIRQPQVRYARRRSRISGIPPRKSVSSPMLLISYSRGKTKSSHRLRWQARTMPTSSASERWL